jgi:hypothetical protein
MALKSGIRMMIGWVCYIFIQQGIKDPGLFTGTPILIAGFERVSVLPIAAESAWIAEFDMSWLGKAVRGAARTANNASIWDAPGKSAPLERLIFPFAESKQLEQYVVTTDKVVGGDTVAALSLKRYTSFSAGCFEGIIRFEPDEAYPNGGFANFRTKPAHRAVFELPFLSMWTYSALAMRVKTDGRLYRFNLHSCDHSKEDVYQVEFTTRPGAWDTLVMPFPSFKLVSRGRVREDQYEFDRSALDGMGVLLADQGEGPFKMEIQWVKAIQEYDAMSARSASDAPHGHWEVQAAHSPGVRPGRTSPGSSQTGQMPQLPTLSALRPTDDPLAEGGASSRGGVPSTTPSRQSHDAVLSSTDASDGRASYLSTEGGEGAPEGVREQVGAMGVPSQLTGPSRQQVEQQLDDAADREGPWVGPASALQEAPTPYHGRPKHTLPGFRRLSDDNPIASGAPWARPSVKPEGAKRKVTAAQRKRLARATQDDVLGPGD